MGASLGIANQRTRNVAEEAGTAGGSELGGGRERDLPVILEESVAEGKLPAVCRALGSKEL